MNMVKTKPLNRDSFCGFESETLNPELLNLGLN